MDIGLVNVLGSIVAKLVGLKTQRKIEVATYMDKIGKTIGEFGPRLNAGALQPELEGYATKARVLATQFSAATSDVLSKELRNEFVAELEFAFNAKEFLMRNAPEKREKWLTDLSASAAKFEAHADSLRASASQI